MPPSPFVLPHDVQIRLVGEGNVRVARPHGDAASVLSITEFAALGRVVHGEDPPETHAVLVQRLRANGLLIERDEDHARWIELGTQDHHVTLYSAFPLAAPTLAFETYLLERVANEAGQELLRAHEDAAQMVGVTRAQAQGEWTQAKAEYSHDTLTIHGRQVMQSWEQPLMRRLAEIAAYNHGHVLEVGFGMGISATALLEVGVASYTVIEPNVEVQARFASWQEQHPQTPTRLVQGFWQDVVPTLETFDGVLFDTYAHLDQPQGDALQAFAPRLRPGGRFTYYTEERHSLCRDVQRRLLACYNEVRLSVVRNLYPPRDCDYWYWPEMVVVEAVK